MDVELFFFFILPLRLSAFVMSTFVMTFVL